MSPEKFNSTGFGKLHIDISQESRWTESFGCAIRTRPLRCSYCGWPLTERGVKRDGGFYCSAYCAGQADVYLRLAEEAHWSTIAVKIYQASELFPSRDDC